MGRKESSSLCLIGILLLAISATRGLGGRAITSPTDPEETVNPVAAPLSYPADRQSAPHCNPVLNGMLICYQSAHSSQETLYGGRQRVSGRSIPPSTHSDRHKNPFFSPSSQPKIHHKKNSNSNGHIPIASSPPTFGKRDRMHVVASPDSMPGQISPTNDIHGKGPSISRTAASPSPNNDEASPLHPFSSVGNSQPLHPSVHSPTISEKHRPPLPPPPPQTNCTPLSCPDPLTNSLPELPCICVLPMKIGLRLSIELYTFFNLVSELAREISAGVFVKQIQVRIMGANAANEDPEKTVVLIHLVPLRKKFQNTTALLIFKRFWHKQIFIDSSYFGQYEVLYVLYPGLPSLRPSASNSNMDDSSAHPFAVDVRNHKRRKSYRLIIVILFSTVFLMALLCGVAWIIFSKVRSWSHQAVPTSSMKAPATAETGTMALGSKSNTPSQSFRSSIATHTGNAKTFSISEMERATEGFPESKIIGEGGFGRVYEGVLQSGKKVAIKVLKRNDQQSSREFLAEVEMLSRLHHRNLVRLIGICIEEHRRCLVYELVPNGSVESHLYGPDKLIAPLDWDARLKIALGAAQALAYLHEDSSPRVIHRDFKCSNIFLENDFTPKVSDFGLARAALGEENEHISTHVVGTFGYVAPEYAMTGHLLVKSDVYSYGVVLLELLTGRKPVDMLRPEGQENLVLWARPLLTNIDTLEMITDPALGNDVSFDSVAKVAAIASMCVQSEVDQRPLMGEVVQALKLVCREDSEYKGSDCCSPESRTKDTEMGTSTSLDIEFDQPIPVSALFSTSARFSGEETGSFRRHSSSGPLRPRRERSFWNGSSSFSESHGHHGLQRDVV